MKTTGFSRVSKESIISEIEKEIKNRPTFFIVDHNTVPSNKLDKLRTKLRLVQGRFFVVKKTLGQKAFERAKLAEYSEHIDGACGIAFAGGDPVASSKALMDFSKENQNFKVKVGSLDGRLVGLDQIKVLASLPSREVMLSRVLGTMQAPIVGFVSVLAGTLRKVVTALDAIAKKKSNQ